MVTSNPLRLKPLSGEHAVCRLSAGSVVPSPEAGLDGFYSLTITPDEISIVCSAESVPPDAVVELGWRGLVVQGPLDFALVGILANLTSSLSVAAVSVFAISTYDTDYIFVKDLPAAIKALAEAGHHVES